MTPDDHKRRLRRAARARRQDLFDAAAPDVARRIAANALAVIVPRRGQVVSAYWPVGSEVDPRLLLAQLYELGAITALPVVERADAALAFRRWHPGMALEVGAYGIPAPGGEAGEVMPEAVLVPLLAFDGAGHRLGYGGGYYDRTLAELRRHGPVLAIGLAFAGQEVEALPRGSYDQALDWIVTEQGARRIEPDPAPQTERTDV